MAYYNDNDEFVVEWLRNLAEHGLIPGGTFDARDIRWVSADKAEAQSHFFAGIGGWAYALRLAGWPDERPVWTGSCPCQPFSQAGKGRGTEDKRHLWSAWLRLIAERRPPTIFGEQVASPAGRAWLARVRADLEALGYAVGCADLCAASVGAPSIGQRLFWVATTNKYDGTPLFRSQNLERSLLQERGQAKTPNGPPNYLSNDGMWGTTTWCGSGTVFRRVEPGTFPLAHGVPCRVGKLRAYGNAICPQVAAEFVAAYLESEKEAQDTEVGT